MAVIAHGARHKGITRHKGFAHDGDSTWRPSQGHHPSQGYLHMHMMMTSIQVLQERWTMAASWSCTATAANVDEIVLCVVRHWYELCCNKRLLWSVLQGYTFATPKAVCDEVVHNR